MTKITPLLLAFFCVSSFASYPKNPNDDRTIEQMVTTQGYPFEQYEVTTEDGYILGMWRIPHGRTSASRMTDGQKPAVILQHGLLDWGFTWFLYDTPENSLPYILADEGFDVFVTNSRGTQPSQNHISLSASDWKFWQFTWDGMAKYDFPANLAYVKKLTGNSKVHWIGHSQGTTQVFAGFMDDPSIQDSLATFTGLGPVITASGISAKGILNVIGKIYTGVHLGEVIARTNPKAIQMPSIGHVIGSFACRFISGICNDIVKAIAGPDYVNPDLLQVVAAHEWGTTSVDNLLHWIQISVYKETEMFNYGKDSVNEAHYGFKTPPKYNLDLLKTFATPKFLVRGEADPLADYSDYQELINMLNTANTRAIEIPKWGHLGYLWAENANALLYPQIVEFLRENNQTPQRRILDPYLLEEEKGGIRPPLNTRTNRRSQDSRSISLCPFN